MEVNLCSKPRLVPGLYETYMRLIRDLYETWNPCYWLCCFDISDVYVGLTAKKSVQLNILLHIKRKYIYISKPI